MALGREHPAALLQGPPCVLTEATFVHASRLVGPSHGVGVQDPAHHLEDPSIEALVGVDLDQAREVLDSLDHQALAALGLDSRVDAPALPTHPVTKEPRLRDVIKEDRLRMTPEAKKVLERAVKPNRRKTQVTASQVLAQILTLGSTDPAAALLGALGVDVAELASALNVVAPAD